MLTSLTLEHIPVHHQVFIALFTDVTNAAELRDHLLAGNAEFEYAFIDSATLVSTVHALTATHQAVHNHLVNKKLRTHNVHSEIVFNLSPNNNIAESFRRFGVAATTKSLLCIKISCSTKRFSQDGVEQHLRKSVSGTMVAFTDENIAKQTDWTRVGKSYKIKSPESTGGRSMEETEVELMGKLVMRVVG